MKPPAQLSCVAFATLSLSTSAVAQPDRARIAELLCSDDANCHVRSVASAGENAAGDAMWVVDVGRAGLDANYGASMWGEECSTHQYWLVVQAAGDGLKAETKKGAKALVDKRLLVEICNDGYGSRGVGEDQVQVKPNRFTHSRSGGSAWGWSQTRVVQLSPTRVIKESSGGYHTLSNQNFELAEWDWQALRGKTGWHAPTCKEDGAPPAAGTEIPATHAYAPIPQLDLPASFRKDGWKRQSFNRCGATVDSAGAGGFVVHGRPGEAGDASMSVVAASPTEFYVSITDDKRQVDAETWLHRDHLEVWAGAEVKSYFEQCLEERVPAVQWAVLTTGEVKRAHGKHDRKLSAEVAGDSRQDAGLRLTYKLTFSKPTKWVSFVYSDSDDGRSQERLIATSKLSFAEGATLGGLRSVPTDEGTCRVSDDQLQWQRAEARPGPGPLLTD